MAQGVAQPKDGDNSCSELQGKAEVDVSTCQGWETTGNYDKPTNANCLSNRSERKKHEKTTDKTDYGDEIDFGLECCSAG